MNNADNRVIVTKQEFNIYQANLRVDNYLKNRPLQAAAFTVAAVSINGVMQSAKMGYFAGVKVNKLLITMCNFIFNKTMFIINKTSQILGVTTEKSRPLVLRNIVMVKQQDYINNTWNLLGVSTSMFSLYLLYKGVYNFYLPVSISAFSLLALDFSINGVDASIFNKVSAFVVDYFNKFECIKLTSLTNTINYLVSLAKLDNSEQHTKLTSLVTKLTDTEK